MLTDAEVRNPLTDNGHAMQQSTNTAADVTRKAVHRLWKRVAAINGLIGVIEFVIQSNGFELSIAAKWERDKLARKDACIVYSSFSGGKLKMVYSLG